MSTAGHRPSRYVQEAEQAVGKLYRLNEPVDPDVRDAITILFEIVKRQDAALRVSQSKQDSLAARVNGIAFEAGKRRTEAERRGEKLS